MQGSGTETMALYCSTLLLKSSLCWEGERSLVWQMLLLSILRYYCYLLGLNSPTCPWEGLRGMGAGMGEDGRKGRRGEGEEGERRWREGGE